MSAEPLPGPLHLRLVDENGEVHSDCPGCEQRDERIHRLLEVQEGLSTRLGTTEAMLTKIKRQLHEDMGLEPKAALVTRVWAEYVRVLHPKTRRKKPPADWLKMGLQRAEDFSEEEMIEAVHGANTEWARNRDTGMVYDEWDNIFRSTGHTRRYIKYAERAKARAKTPAPAPGMKVHGVVTLLQRAGLYDDLRAFCPRCGQQMRVHASSGRMHCFGGCSKSEIGRALADAVRRNA